MTQAIKLYFDEDTAEWLRAQGSRNMSWTANELIRAHMNAAKPSPIADAIDRLTAAMTRRSFTNIMDALAPEPEPTAAEENSAAAEKLSQMF